MVGFNRRFDPDFRAVKAAIDEGTVGKVEMVTITSPRSRRRRRSTTSSGRAASSAT